MNMAHGASALARRYEGIRALIFLAQTNSTNFAFHGILSFLLDLLLPLKLLFLIFLVLLPLLQISSIVLSHREPFSVLHALVRCLYLELAQILSVRNRLNISHSSVLSEEQTCLPEACRVSYVSCFIKALVPLSRVLIVSREVLSII